MQSDFYLDERQRKKRRRRLKLKIYGGIFLFFILAVGVAYLIVYSPFFQIKQITADGKEVDGKEIIEDLKNFFAGQSKITSFLGAGNILIWDNKKLAEFHKNPEIADLTIEKDYLERQIRINIRERERFGMWCLQAQTNADHTQTNAENEISPRESTLSPRESAFCFWFDKNGVIFAEAPFVEGNLINNVDDFSGRSLKLGELVLAEKFFSNLLKIFEVLEKSDLGIKSLKLEKLEFQEIITESSPKIYFSLRIDPKFTLAAIESIKNLGLERIKYIDLRVENRVYYKLK